MKIPKIKRNYKLEMLIVTIVVVIIGIATIVSIFMDKQSKPTEQNPTVNTQEQNPAENTQEENQETKNPQPSEATTVPTIEPLEENPVIDYSKISFPLTSKTVKNIEIISESNGICSEDNNWQLKFAINNKLANKQKKYAYQINTSHGTVFVSYDKGLNPSDFDNALNFYYREEYGKITPILDDGITWIPPEEEVESVKFFVQVIDLSSRNIESVFNILINKDGSSYRIAGIESAELVGSDKEKAYTIALDYYKSKDGTIEIKGIDSSVVAIAPRTQNNLYYVDNVPINGTGIGPIIVVYINYNSGGSLTLPQGCFIVYLDKNTFEIIGEGKMNFAE